MPRVLNLADALRAEGVEVIEVAGWQTRGRDNFVPALTIAHHTASNKNYNAPSLNICINGRSDLPGPLCQVLIARNGVAYVIASGTANHAGVGDYAGVSGNSKAFGIEVENDGVGEPWSDTLMEAYVRVVTALCRIAHIGVDKVCAHYEYAKPRGRKVDPRGHSDFMTRFRSRVDTRLKNNTTTPNKPPTNPTDNEEKELMAAKDDIIKAEEESRPVALRGKTSNKVYVVSGAGKWYVNGRDLLNLLYFTKVIRPNPDNQPPVIDDALLDKIPNID